MGFTLVNLDTRFDQEILDVATTAGLALTLDDVHAAQTATWREWMKKDATRVWEPAPAADQAISLELDRQICLRLGINDPALHAEVNRRGRAIFQNPATYSVFPEVFDTLARLRESVPVLGILSNWGWWLPELCTELGLAAHFDFIITSARVGANKPHPLIFKEALARAGSQPSRMLHVGDSLVADVQGARAAGMTGVLLDRSGTATSGEYPIIRSLDQVQALL